MFEGPQPAVYRRAAWRQLCADIRKFVHSGKAERALAAGWEPIELFGCYGKPWELPTYAKWPPLGTWSLVMLLNGRSVGYVGSSRIEILNSVGPHNHLHRAHLMARQAECDLIWKVFEPSGWPHGWGEGARL